MIRRRSLAVVVAVFCLVGCAQPTPLSGEDRAALEQLGGIAARDAAAAGVAASPEESGQVEPGEIECWAPSESMIDEAGFRVICRVHYEQSGEQRYRDMICIGELGRDPVSDHCYEWAPYSDMPAFEDRLAYAAG